MKAKILKHKTLPGTYGTFYDGELCQSDLFDLFPMTCTIKGLSKYTDKKELSKYKLCEVDITLNE